VKKIKISLWGELAKWAKWTAWAGLFFLGSLFADANHSQSEKNWYVLSAGLRGSNLTQFRGAVFYDAWQVVPVVYLGLLDHQIQFLGNSLEYVSVPATNDEARLRLRTKVNSVTDDPLYVTTQKRGIRNTRPTAYEWMTTMEYFFSSKKSDSFGEINSRVAYDLKTHHGLYGELQFKYLIGKFIERNQKYLLQPQPFVTVGYGSADHNRHYYGPEADLPSLTHLQFGMNFLLMPGFDSAYPAFSVQRFQVLGSNRSGQTLDGVTSGYQVVGYLAFKLL
jgi:hypothetical protein